MQTSGCPPVLSQRLNQYTPLSPFACPFLSVKRLLLFSLGERTNSLRVKVLGATTRPAARPVGAIIQVSVIMSFSCRVLHDLFFYKKYVIEPSGVIQLSCRHLNVRRPISTFTNVRWYQGVSRNRFLSIVECHLQHHADTILQAMAVFLLVSLDRLCPRRHPRNFRKGEDTLMSPHNAHTR